MSLKSLRQFFLLCLFIFLSVPVLSLSSFAYTESWANYCEVVRTISMPIYHSEEHFGWKYPIRTIGDANPPPGGNGGAFYIHPVSMSVPAHVKCKFPQRNMEAIRVKVAGNINGGWIMVLRVNGRTVKTVKVDGKRWYVYTIPVKGDNNGYTTVDLFAKANGWFFEYAFIDEIKPILSSFVKIDKRPVAYYSFDTCTAKDYSGHGLNGDIKGNVACVNGVKGKAFYFSGDGYVKLPPFGAIWSRGMSVCAWVRFEEPRNFEKIIDFGNGPGDSSGMNVWFGRTGSTNNISVESWINSDGNLNRSRGRLTYFDGIESRKAKYYCFTINNSNKDMAIYIDGRKVAEKLGNPVANVKRFQNFIGHSNWSFFDPDFKGMIDEVKIFNYPLSPGQIAALYRRTRVLQKSPLGSKPKLPVSNRPVNRVKFGKCAVISELSAAAFDRAAGAQPTYSVMTKRIYAVCKVSSPGRTNIDAIWYYFTPSGEKEYIIRKSITISRPVTDNYLKFYLEMSPGRNWPQGKYEVDILVNGNVRKILYFI
ncbi:LamG domain-containing protein [Desulfurobacterium sp.]